MTSPTHGDVTRAIAPIFALLTGTALLVVGSGLYGTLIALRGSGEGFASTLIGLIMSAYYIGFMLGTIGCPALIEQVGHIRTFAGLASIASAVSLAHVLVVDPWLWTGLRLVAGLCFAGMFMAIESWLNQNAAPRVRGRVFSLYMVVNLAALAVGQMMLTVAAVGGFVLFCLTSILISLALVPVTFTRAVAPPVTAAPRLSIARLYAISPLGLVCCTAAGVVVGATLGMGAVFGAGIGLDEDGVAHLMAMTAFGGLVLQWPFGWLSDHFDRRWVIIWVAVGAAAVAALILLLWAPLRPYLTLPMWLFGGLILALYSLGVAHTNDFSTRESPVRVAGGLLLVYGGGAVLGPLAAGVVMEAVGPLGLFVLTGAALVLTAAYGLYRTRVREPLPAEAQAPFVPAPRTTPVVYELSPLTEAPEAEPAEAARPEEREREEAEPPP